MSAVTFPLRAKAWAVKEGGGFEETHFDVESLQQGEVLVKIELCGVCHTDFFLFNSPGKIPGHEMVGHVSALGPQVSGLEIGQRVGVGWQYSSCKQCEYCENEDEILCSERVSFMNKRGGYAEYVVWDSKFVIPVPQNILSEHAGPLMCAGLTVYTALHTYLGGPRSESALGRRQQHVAVVGIGGLGHLAIQFAHKMGAHVTAVSTSSSKEAEARSFGADAFLNTSVSGALEGAKRHFDLILNCVSGDINWGLYLQTLRPLGRLCVLGVPKSAISFNGGDIIMESRQVVGSLTGGTRDIKEMFQFVSHHNIKPLVEVLPIEKISEAIEKVEKNSMRYRMVLKIA